MFLSNNLIVHSREMYCSFYFVFFLVCLFVLNHLFQDLLSIYKF